jgi:hypothetical protein
MQLFIIFYKMFSEEIIIPTFQISFKVYGKASGKHKLIIIKFTDPLLCKISSSKNCGYINPLNAELNPSCHLLALLGAHPILHVSRIRVKFV